MRKSEILATIKTANAIVDRMASYAVDTEEYADLNESLGYILDSLMFDRQGFVLNLSKRTGHYWVKFS